MPGIGGGDSIPVHGRDSSFSNLQGGTNRVGARPARFYFLDHAFIHFFFFGTFSNRLLLMRAGRLRFSGRRCISLPSLGRLPILLSLLYWPFGSTVLTHRRRAFQFVTSSV